MRSQFAALLVLAASSALVIGCGHNTCVDNDKDGFGDGCALGPDCDDSAAASHPDGGEICDGLDNNCDGRIDEVCTCKEGSTQKCFAGETRNRGKGACVDGTQTCAAGQWGPCQGSIGPVAESCNGIDDNCDGPVDEDVTQSCYDGPSGTKGVGACKDGALFCIEAKFQGACVGEVLPTPEQCNNIDDNCNGQTDEALSKGCFSGPASARNVGACKDGTQSCSAGAWGSCSGEVLPGTESCNNIDDDCDGRVDESVTRSCYSGPTGTSGVGQCRSGVETCSAGSFGACAGERLPTVEQCNNVDDNCNGQTDENITRACYDGPASSRLVGLCRDGTQTCSAGAFGLCAGERVPAPFDSCAVIGDDDCNGRADEDCGPGDSCNQPTPLNTAAPSDSVNGDVSPDAGLGDDFAGCGVAGAPDSVFSFSLAQDERVTLTAATDAGWDVAVSLRGPGGCPSTQLTCTNAAPLGGTERLTRVVRAGTYYAVVEPGSGQGGPFNLTLSHVPVPQGDSCGNEFNINGNVPVDAGIVTQSFVGDTSVAANNDITIGGCGDPTTNDLVYSLDLPAGRAVTLTLDAGTAWAPALAVTTGSACPGSVTACSSGAVAGSRSLAIELGAGHHDIIVRGGAAGAAGAYQLDVALGGAVTYAEGASPATYIDACAGGTQVLPVPASHTSAVVSLPFDFPFFGQVKPQGTTAYLLSNGYLSFDSSGDSYPGSFSNFPTSVIAPYWIHIHNQAGNVCHRVVGSAPNRQWVIEYRNQYMWDLAFTGSFEMILNEGGAVDFLYQNVAGSAPIGLKNSDGTKIYSHTNPMGAALNGTAIRFSP